MGSFVNNIEILPATIDDIKTIHQIYADSVLNETASWEYDPPSLDEFTKRYDNIIGENFPYLVAKLNGEIAGFAYANHYRARIGYRFCVENSIYVSPQFKRCGIATKLMQQLILECKNKGFKYIIAVIGDSENIGSIELHQKLGFKQVGHLPSIGFKFDKWLDSVIMQYSIA